MRQQRSEAFRARSSCWGCQRCSGNDNNNNRSSYQLQQQHQLQLGLPEIIFWCNWKFAFHLLLTKRQVEARRAKPRPGRATKEILTILDETQQRLIGIWSCCCRCRCIYKRGLSEWQWHDLPWLGLPWRLQAAAAEQQRQRLHLPLWMNVGEIALDRREYMRSYNNSSQIGQPERAARTGSRTCTRSLVNRNCDTVCRCHWRRCQNRFRVREPQLCAACLGHVCTLPKRGNAARRATTEVAAAPATAAAARWLCTCRRFCSPAAAQAAFEKCHILRAQLKPQPPPLPQPMPMPPAWPKELAESAAETAATASHAWGNLRR